ncbi:Leucine--tRNA ligase [Bienertia sinuspersici]
MDDLNVEEVKDDDINEQILSPEESLKMLKEKSEFRRNFSEWLSVIHTKHPVARIDWVKESKDKMPVLHLDSEVENNSVEKSSFQNAIEHAVSAVKAFESESKTCRLNEPVKIELEDIKPENEFWNSAIICYVLGANPPIGVLRVLFGVYGGRRMLTRPFFDHNPVIMKPWSENDDCTKDNVRSIPIWIQLYLDFKYWGIRSLEKIVGKVGKLVKVDQATEKRERLNYARCLVEVMIDQDFPDSISFINDKDQITDVAILYQWKPVICSKCKKFGHRMDECRVLNKPAQEWRGKKQTMEKNENTKQDDDGGKEVVVEEKAEIDQGLQEVKRPARTTEEKSPMILLGMDLGFCKIKM